MKVGLAQINCEVGDLEQNCSKFDKYAALAKKQGCKVVLFPEMSDTGYVTSTFSKSAQTWPSVGFKAASKAASLHSINLICGISEKENDSVYNSLAAFNDSGELIAKYRKTHLFSPAPVSEDKYCVPGSKAVVVEIAGIPWGLSICYDLRFPELYRSLMLKGAQVLFNASAWPATRPTHWDHLSRARAIENQCFFLGVNRVGVDENLRMHGKSRVVAPMGDILAEASSDAEELLVAEIDLKLINDFRTKIPAVKSRRDDIYGNLKCR